MRNIARYFVVAVLCYPGVAGALGLGKLTLNSFLNEPFDGEVELLEMGDLDPAQVKVRLATREDFTRAGVERAYFLTSLRFAVVGTDGDYKLAITSREPVLEPYLDFIVEARWPTGRLLREYTVLLDPPVYVGSDRGITARESAKESQARAREEERGTSGATPRTPRGTETAERSFTAGASETPSSGGKYLVRRDDTLWSIAAAGRPGGTSVQQTMLDIQRLNPEAFIGGNINQLKAGYVLRLPSEEDITRQSFDQAVAAVVEQQRRWQRGVSDVDTRIDASAGQDYSSVSGSDRGEGHLQIAGEEAKESDFAPGDVSARMEDLDRSRRENNELSTRLGAVEDQVKLQERLISLKDQQIAALQEALANAGGTAPPEPEGTTTPPPTSEGVVETGVDPVIEPIPDAAESMEPAEAATTEPEPPARPTPRPPPPAPPTLVDLLMENLLYVGGGIILLLLALAFLLRNRLPGLSRGGDKPVPARGGGDAEDEFAGVNLSEDSLIVDEFADDAEAEADATEAVVTFSAPDEEAYAAQFETGDALAEADIYIAYGRFPQAVDLLKTAISVEPINTDYRMKLMEACVEMVDSSEFQQQYADLEVIGDEHVLQRARDLLDAVDGGEVWLEDLPRPTLTEAEVAAARAAHDALPASEPEELAGVDLGLDDQLEEDAGDNTTLDDDGASLEFDAGAEVEALDLDTETDADGDFDSIEYAVAGQSDDDADSLELELDVDDVVAGDELAALDDDVIDLEEPELEEQAEEVDLPDLELDEARLEESDLSDLAEFEPESEDELLSDLEELDLGLGDEADIAEAPEAEEKSEQLDELGDLAEEEELAGQQETEEEQSLLDLSSDLEMSELSALDEDFDDDEAAGEFALDEVDGDLDLGDLDLGEDEEGSEASVAELDLSDLLEDDDDGELNLEALGAEEGESVEDLDLGDLGDDEDDEEIDLSSFADDGSADESALDLSDLTGDSELDGEDFALDDAAAEPDVESMELDMSEATDENGNGFVFAADGDEVATKLDLARAYIDMGDHDGARSILEEVQNEGDDSQKAEAQELLGGID
jgi:pilus assembly protein FimV